MKTQRLQPCGTLLFMDMDYQLLRPAPLTSMTEWERETGATRWMVTHLEEFDFEGDEALYAAPYHLIVSAPFTIRYNEQSEILCKVSKYDLMYDGIVEAPDLPPEPEMVITPNGEEVPIFTKAEYQEMP